MKKQFIFLAVIILFGGTANAQTIKKAEKDTVKTGGQNDRLRNAGPVNGTSKGNKPDTARKVKAAPAHKGRAGN